MVCDICRGVSETHDLNGRAVCAPCYMDVKDYVARLITILDCSGPEPYSASAANDMVEHYLDAYCSARATLEEEEKAARLEDEHDARRRGE